MAAHRGRTATRRGVAPRRAATLLAGAALVVALRSRAFAVAECGASAQNECEDRSSRRQVLQSSLAAMSLESALAPAWAAEEKDVVLNNGLKFPKVSFGLQIYNDDTAQQLTELSLSLGYRNFFSSVLAGNQPGFAKGLKASGVPRDEVFVCGSVVSNRARGFKPAYLATKRGISQNLAAFQQGGLTYVDMMMLDYPGPDCESIKGQWEAFEEMLASGKTKSLAVSNFSPEQLDCILSNQTATKPAVNQLPYSISYAEPQILEENKKRGILVQAWAPLGGSTGGISKKAQTLCGEIGKNYGKSWAQVALRWILEQGRPSSRCVRSARVVVTPKGLSWECQDIDIFDFKLSAEDLAALEKIA
ncbi:9 [Durusdinium trenchii]|uniref:11-endoperoxide prostaglandin H2 reductase (Prostaglandin F2-alpha synthase) n=1 Tax=Durusdinium trenchii TaxID=1381693 RepID=A0ABP0KZD2_9DINO